ncbi:MAG: glucose-6-phosphate dehydrogenase assembly protein OpcA [Gammaproteobacteria bacterium]|nr:glucose-6-phosphate dehydrogenase assembly protein OpcA [Gammaproteobacteria bacterium]
MRTQKLQPEIFTHSSKNPFRIADIGSELTGLWTQFNEDISEGKTVMRACMSNLIIYCDNTEELERIGQDIALVVDIHPARVLLLMGGGNTGKEKLNARTTIYYQAVSGGWQVCAERIDVISNKESLEYLPSVARSHIIGDLPTTVWWVSRQPPPKIPEVFKELSELANQVIYDNIGWANPFTGISMMTRWVAARQDSLIVYNLAWRRLTVLRRLISQVLDPKVAPHALDALYEIKLQHGPHALPLTWLLIGWLACQLGWTVDTGKRVSASELYWRFRRNNQEIKVSAQRLPEGEPIIYEMMFNWKYQNKDGCACFRRLDDERIAIVEEVSTLPARVFSAQLPQRATMVTSQLARRDRDKFFENALIAANRMTDSF